MRKGGRGRGGESKGGSEMERVKITFVRLPSNMLHSARGWVNPVFPAADPQTAPGVVASRLTPLPLENKQRHAAPTAVLGWSEGLEMGQRVFLENYSAFSSRCMSERKGTYAEIPVFFIK